jgi:hypothetical protein
MFEPPVLSLKKVSIQKKKLYLYYNRWCLKKWSNIVFPVNQTLVAYANFKCIKHCTKENWTWVGAKGSIFATGWLFPSSCG